MRAILSFGGLASVVVSLSLISPQARSQVLLDQQVIPPNNTGITSYHIVAAGFSWAQTVQAGLNGQLVRIDLPLSKYPNTSLPLVVSIYPTTVTGAPNDSGAPLTSVSFAPSSIPNTTSSPPPYMEIDLPNGPTVHVGDQFSIVLQSQTPEVTFSNEYLWQATNQGSDPYPQGNFEKSTQNPFWFPLGGGGVQDQGFSTFVAVPEPSALIGLAAVVPGMNRRRRITSSLAAK